MDFFDMNGFFKKTCFHTSQMLWNDIAVRFQVEFFVSKGLIKAETAVGTKELIWDKDNKDDDKIKIMIE